MATVKLKINGQEIEVEQGSTILQAANKVGLYIPTLCYHPYLPLEEACRVCVVEEVRGGWSSLVAACVYPVRNGMVLETDSEMVNQARRAIVDLLLSNHPNDCMSCYAAGDCELQDVVFRYGVKPKIHGGESWKLPVDSDPNPCLFIDMNKCILCRRCVRACHEIQGADIWTKKGRGFHQKVTTAFDTTLEEAGCEFCGHCADFCPVDAIGFRAGRGSIRNWQLEPRSTVCMQCTCGCIARYETADDKIIRVRGDFNSPASTGALCNRGRYNFTFINSPHRVTGASVRNGGGLEPASVEDAVKAAAAGLGRIKAQSGGAAVGILCGGMLTNEEYFAAQRLARAALETNNVDNVAGPWQQAAYEGLKACFGPEPAANTLDSIAEARSILALGSNILEKQAIAALRARKAAREEATLIVAHPDYVRLKKTATLSLQIAEGSEGALVAGFIKTIVQENLAVGQVDSGNPALKSAESLSWADISERTALPETAIREAARLYAANRPAALLYGIEPKSSPAKPEFYTACGLLQQLVNAEAPEKTVYILGASGNAQGAAEFGALPAYLPGCQPVAKPGLSWPEMVSAIEKGGIKGLYLIGADPFALGLPEEQVKTALSRLEFLVVQDCVKTEAFDQANVVLPAASFVEKEGTATNCERRTQELSPVVPSPGDARSDLELINRVLAVLAPQLVEDELESSPEGDDADDAVQPQSAGADSGPKPAKQQAGKKKSRKGK